MKCARLKSAVNMTIAANTTTAASKMRFRRRLSLLSRNSGEFIDIPLISLNSAELIDINEVS